jgi:uncharacterized protein (TIGR01777 family)
MRVAIVGGTGFLGRRLTRMLAAQGHTAVWLSRDPAAAAQVMRETGATEAYRFVQERTDGEWAPAIATCDVLVNLAGSSIGDRWTPRTRARIIASRVDLTRRLVDAMEAHRLLSDRGGREPLPGALVQITGIGMYGDRGDDILTEAEPPGADWLSQVGWLWEEQAARAAMLDMRVAVLRTGLVLGEEGLLDRFLTPMRMFAGGPIGTGRQWMPWIHVDDAVGVLAKAVVDERMAGPYNSASPNPVTVREFTQTLGRVLHRPSWTRVPEPALRLVVGPAASAYVSSQRPDVARLLDAGYAFRFPGLEAALEDLLGRS